MNYIKKSCGLLWATYASWNVPWWGTLIIGALLVIGLFKLLEEAVSALFSIAALGVLATIVWIFLLR